MISQGDVRAEADRLVAAFQAAGAVRIESDILQPADILLDLYGEDIRARAFVTHDANRGELMLRPDFTVPVVQAHMAEGQEPARYTYAGAVFRAADSGAAATETWQVGYEVFDRTDPAAADAEVFAQISALLTDLPLRAATGDIGVLTAAVSSLTTSEKRRAALMRHIWRPQKFTNLIKRFSAIGTTRPAPTSSPKDYAEIGIRSSAEVAQRLQTLVEDVDQTPLLQNEVAIINAILELREKSPNALIKLRELAREMAALVPAVDRIEMRLNAMAARGVDVENLDFEGSYGRTSMEYYDGFVFGFYTEDAEVKRAVATGGRYDALTQVLGQGRSIPAVGGVIRPRALLKLRGQS